MIKKFIKLISEDNKFAKDAMLTNIIMTKVNTALDIKRIEMAVSVYNESMEDDIAFGKQEFLKLNLKVGAHTNVGDFIKSDDDAAYFMNGPNRKTIPFGAKVIGGKSTFSNIRVLTDIEWEEKQQTHTDTMQAHVNRTPKRID